MKRTLILSVLFGLFICALIAGCTSPTSTGIQPAGTQAPSAPSASSPQTTATTVLPAAVETLSANQFVDLQLTKDRTDSSIHLLYNGGQGEVAVQKIVLRVTRSDGQVVESVMDNGTRKPQRGDEVIIQGTRGNDRGEVFVTSAGRTYKIIDQPVIVIS